jgi:hypothetical protein
VRPTLGAFDDGLIAGEDRAGGFDGQRDEDDSARIDLLL